MGDGSPTPVHVLAAILGIDKIDSAVKTIIPPALIVMMSWVVFWMDKAA